LLVMALELNVLCLTVHKKSKERRLQAKG